MKNFLLLSFLLPVLLYAQNYNGAFNNLQPESFSFDNLGESSNSFVEAGYGFSNLQYYNYLTSPAAKGTATEIIYGTRSIKPTDDFSIMKFEDEFFFSSYISSLAPQNNNEINFNLWKFGLGYRKGYGLNFSPTIIVFPYYEIGLVWNRGSFSEPNTNRSYFNRFNNALRFGISNTAGMNLKLSSLITIGASFETSLVYPRYLFFKQFGSFFIELLSQTGIDYLTKGVLLKATPKTTPFIYFLLKNGLSYLFYTLKKEKMNWPFETEPPLRLETFKIKLSITF